MPNWASNTVIIYGNREDLQAILDKGAKGTYQQKSDWDEETRTYKTITEQPNQFSFENFLPTPPELLKGEGWYDWRVSNWGTKWNLGQDSVEITDITEFEFGDGEKTHRVMLDFSTAWSPALELFTEISKQFPTVRIENRYWEEGVAYIGEAFMENGECFDYSEELDNDHYKKAGATMMIDEDGDEVVDWDNSEPDLSLVFPLV